MAKCVKCGRNLGLFSLTGWICDRCRREFCKSCAEMELKECPKCEGQFCPRCYSEHEADDEDFDEEEPEEEQEEDSNEEDEDDEQMENDENNTKSSYTLNISFENNDKDDFAIEELSKEDADKILASLWEALSSGKKYFRFDDGEILKIDDVYRCCIEGDE